MTQSDNFIHNPFQVIFEKLLSIESDIASLRSLINNRESIKEEVERLMTLPEAAQLLRVSNSSMYRFCAERTIPFIKRKGKLLFQKKELISWAAEGRQKALKEIEQDSEVWLGSLRKK